MRLRYTEKRDIERLEFGDTVLIVKPLTSGDLTMIQIDSMIDGEIDPLIAAREEWRHVLVGWEGLVDPKGNDVPYTREVACYIEEVVGDDGPKRVLRGVGPSLPPNMAELVRLSARKPAFEIGNALKNAGESSPDDSVEPGTPSTG